MLTGGLREQAMLLAGDQREVLFIACDLHCTSVAGSQDRNSVNLGLITVYAEESYCLSNFVVKDCIRNLSRYLRILTPIRTYLIIHNICGGFLPTRINNNNH